MYVHTQNFRYFGQWLSDVNTFEMKNFDTHIVFICNIFNYKPKILRKPQNAGFSFERVANIFAARQSFICNLAKHMFGTVDN